MPGNVFIPFNNQPYDIGLANSGYTVPTGYYARVLLPYTLSTLFNASSTSVATTASGNPISISHTPGHKQDRLEFWLRETDAIDLTYTAASGTLSHASSATTATFSVTTNTSTLEIKIFKAASPTSIIILKAQSEVCFSVGPVTASPTITLGTWSGNFSGYFVAEVFPNLGT